jgi:acetyl-CoA synthetase
MITTLLGIQGTRPSSAGKRCRASRAAVLSHEGNDSGTERASSCCASRGLRCCACSTREEDRFVEAFWSKYGRDVYFVGHAAQRMRTATSGSLDGSTT